MRLSPVVVFVVVKITFVQWTEEGARKGGQPCLRIGGAT